MIKTAPSPPRWLVAEQQIELTLQATKNSAVHAARKRFPLSCFELVEKGKRRKLPLGIFLHQPPPPHTPISATQTHPVSVIGCLGTERSSQARLTLHFGSACCRTACGVRVVHLPVFAVTPVVMRGHNTPPRVGVTSPRGRGGGAHLEKNGASFAEKMAN